MSLEHLLLSRDPFKRNESQGHILALTVLCVPYPLDSGNSGLMDYDGACNDIFFFITLKPRVECYTMSMSLKYEPASEPLHISVR